MCFAVQIADCLLIGIQNSIMNGFSTIPDTLRMKSFNTFQILLDALNDRHSEANDEQIKTIYSEIWALESLQSFLRRLPNSIDKI